MQCHYDAYQQAHRRIQELQALVRLLSQSGERAALVARAQPGTLDERLTAIRAAWVPYQSQIAEVEREIAALYDSADVAFDACWQGRYGERR